MGAPPQASVGWILGRTENHSSGVDRDVTFVAETDPAAGDRIDAAYRAKYRRYSASYVDPMVAPAARAATLKLVPR
jgi:hypothetical protein